MHIADKSMFASLSTMAPPTLSSVKRDCTLVEQFAGNCAPAAGCCSCCSWAGIKNTCQHRSYVSLIYSLLLVYCRLQLHTERWGSLHSYPPLCFLFVPSSLLKSRTSLIQLRSLWEQCKPPPVASGTQPRSKKLILCIFMLNNAAATHLVAVILLLFTKPLTQKVKRGRIHHIMPPLQKAGVMSLTLASCTLRLFTANGLCKRRVTVSSA